MISAEGMKTTGDEGLFELFRETSRDYTTLIKEIISRWHEGKLSPALLEEFVLIQMNCTASIIDLSRDPVDKKELMKNVGNMIDTVCDDKR